jgi:PAS domain S-box-containing protein
VHVLLKNYRKDGRAYWNELNISPVRDGELTHFIGICSDVTTRQEAQALLHEREWLLSQDRLWRISAVLIGISRPTGSPGRKSFTASFGIEPGTTISLDLVQRFMPREDLKRLEQVFAAASAEGFVEFDQRIVRPGGETRVVQLRGKRIMNGAQRLIRISGTVQDVTEARQAEAAVRESEARFRAIMDSAVDAVITMDQELRITGFNPAAEKMFGRSFGEVAGHSICDTILPPEQWKGRSASFREFLESQDNSADARRIELMAGERMVGSFPAELTITRTESDHGAIYTGFIRDLTATKAAEAAAHASTQETLNQQSALLALASREPTDFETAVRSILKTDATILNVARTSYWCFWVRMESHTARLSTFSPKTISSRERKLERSPRHPPKPAVSSRSSLMIQRRTRGLRPTLNRIGSRAVLAQFSGFRCGSAAPSLGWFATRILLREAGRWKSRSLRVRLQI